jgi:hypothetical protein
MGGLDIARSGERQKRRMKSLKHHDESQGKLILHRELCLALDPPFV